MVFYQVKQGADFTPYAKTFVNTDKICYMELYLQLIGVRLWTEKERFYLLRTALQFTG